MIPFPFYFLGVFCGVVFIGEASIWAAMSDLRRGQAQSRAGGNYLSSGPGSSPGQLSCPETRHLSAAQEVTQTPHFTILLLARVCTYPRRQLFLERQSRTVTVVPEKTSIAAVLSACREDARTGQSLEEGCDQVSTGKSEVTAFPQPAGLQRSPPVRHLRRKRCSGE